jgi:hypothetical protein
MAAEWLKRDGRTVIWVKKDVRGGVPFGCTRGLERNNVPGNFVPYVNVSSHRPFVDAMRLKGR